MAALLRRLPWLRPWKPLISSNTNFPEIAPHQKIEEETFPDYVASRYYAVRIGEILKDRYQIVGKLGFGASSTVWLARDMAQDTPIYPPICVTLLIGNIVVVSM